MSLTPEEVDQRLHGVCAATTLEGLVKLAGMTDAKPGIIVPPRFFWCGNDRVWLSRRKLIEQRRYGYVITPEGQAVVEQLRSTLVQICP